MPLSVSNAEPQPRRWVEGLDAARVGEVLLRLPAVAALMRHTTLQMTFEYVADGDQEQEYVRDVLTLSVQEMVAKWHGGQLAATGMAAALAAGSIDAHREKISQDEEPE